MTTHEMLFAGNPILGRVFTFKEGLIFFASSLFASLFLLLPAWVFRLHSIPTGKGNTGFFYSYNWSIMYPIVIPLLLAMVTAVSKQMRNCILEFVDKGRITNRSTVNAPSYPIALSQYLKERASRLLVIVFFISLTVMVIDTFDLWWNYLKESTSLYTRQPDWDIAFKANYWGKEYESVAFNEYKKYLPSEASNLTFDITAYLFQGVALFLGLYWLGNFALFLIAFANLLSETDSRYQFNPLRHDIERRMGLKPMGKLFDNFLAITLVIQAYAFYHRLHLIHIYRKQPVIKYIKDTFFKIVYPPESKNIPSPFTHFIEVFKLESWAFDALFNAGGLITIFFMTVPVIIICFLPLYKIRKLLETRRNEEIDRLQQEFEQALETKNYDRLQVVEYEKESLENSNVWPNGDARAKRYLNIIIALALGAIAPPFLAIVIVYKLSESLYKHINLIFQKKAS